MGGIGITFLLVGLTLPSAGRRYEPERIVFDDERGAVCFTQRGVEAYIPYDDIAGMEIVIRRIPSTSSSGSSSTTRTVYHHVATIRRKTGGSYQLLEAHTPEGAQSLLTLIHEKVHLDRPLKGLEATLPVSLRSATAGEATWRNRVLGRAAPSSAWWVASASCSRSSRSGSPRSSRWRRSCLASSASCSPSSWSSRSA